MLSRAVVRAAATGARAASSVVQPPRVPDVQVVNEPILGYRGGSAERRQLEAELARLAAAGPEEVPIVIGGESIRDGEPRYQVMPHDKATKIAKYYWASERTIAKAIETATAAQARWDRTPFEERARIFLRAADLMAGEHRQRLNAATVCGQSKNAFQAEIDSACELVDFTRFNVHFLREALRYQPLSPEPRVTLNSMRFRGLDGFVAAISPFNFSAIGGNLAYAPALMGNAVLWKPSDTAVLSNWRIFNIMREAGVPDGVVNFVPADGPVFGRAVTASKHLAAINFTGSVPTFNWLWKAVAQNVDKYVNYPRLIGECGGKNYHFVHPSADVDTVVAQTIRSAFEYCGQKCSACSRLYLPRSLHAQVVPRLAEARARLRVGDPRDFATFMGAVIDDKAFARITGYIERARADPRCTIVGGGQHDDSRGYFVQPTIIETKDPEHPLMKEEIFGPVLTLWTYEDAELQGALAHVHTSTPFALTGAVFARDEAFLRAAFEELRYSAGNFYVNDKSTGAVVGQQPFGGGRMSGTNDKAGGPNYILRFASPQCVKETFVPLPDVDYPYMRD